MTGKPADAGLIAQHIRDRLAKSKMDSPAINISREGWALILSALAAMPKHPQEQRLREAVEPFAALADIDTTWDDAVVLRVTQGSDHIADLTAGQFRALRLALSDNPETTEPAAMPEPEGEA